MEELTVEEMEQIQGGSLFGLHWSATCIGSMIVMVGVIGVVSTLSAPIALGYIISTTTGGIGAGIGYASSCVLGS